MGATSDKLRPPATTPRLRGPSRLFQRGFDAPETFNRRAPGAHADCVGLRQEGPTGSSDAGATAIDAADCPAADPAATTRGRRPARGAAADRRGLNQQPIAG